MDTQGISVHPLRFLRFNGLSGNCKKDLRPSLSIKKAEKSERKHKTKIKKKKAKKHRETVQSMDKAVSPSIKRRKIYSRRNHRLSVVA